MTRKEMISACLDDQIARGIIKAEDKQMQLNCWLNGKYGMKRMSLSDCKRWYNAVYNK